MKIAVIVTTYNRPDALKLVLAGYAAQSERDFELIVADDGSTPDTRDAIHAFSIAANRAVTHVWQEDDGFRAAAIRNRAVAATDADYLLFTDGDCVPTVGFLDAHRSLAERGWFVAGNRVLLNEAFSHDVTARQLPIFAWSAAQWREIKQAGGVNRLSPLRRIPLPGVLRKLGGRRWQKVRTCNFSLFRTDFAAVNGFDESYTGWGLEDSDLAIRLIRAGVRHKSARFAAPVFHLWHREFDRRQLPENADRLATVLASDRVTAARGLDQYR